MQVGLLSYFHTTKERIRKQNEQSNSLFLFCHDEEMCFGEKKALVSYSFSIKV